MQQHSLLPNNTADRGFKRSTFMPCLNVMACEKRGYGTGRFRHKPINIGVLARASVRAAGCCPTPNAMYGSAPQMCRIGICNRIGCHGWKTPWNPNQLSSRSGEGGGLTVCNQLMNGNHPPSLWVL